VEEKFPCCPEISDTIPRYVEAPPGPEKILHIISGYSLRLGALDAERAAPHIEAELSPRGPKEVELIEQVYVPQIEPLYAEIQHFLGCVRDHRQPLVGAQDAIGVMTVADLVEEQVLASIGRVNRATP